MVEIDTNVIDFSNRTNFGVIVCTSGTRPTAVDGKAIYETDTDLFLVYDGASWEEIGGGGATDHGGLTGLEDDDHTQYLLVNGGRSMTGNLTVYKSNPYVIVKPNDSSSPALILEDSSSNYKGRFYVNSNDAVVLCEDGDLYLSTAVSTGGNVLLETKGVTRLTIDDTVITSTVSIIPSSDSSMDLGSATYAWDELFVDRIAGGDENDDAALDLDFRGDGSHRIWYNGTSANELEYKTYLRHRFMIQSTEVLNIDSDEIAVETGMKVGLNSVGGGTYIKDDASGNMELHVASGKVVKIVVG